jgi:hypothetical protein
MVGEFVCGELGFGACLAVRVACEVDSDVALGGAGAAEGPLATTIRLEGLRAHAAQSPVTRGSGVTGGPVNGWTPPLNSAAFGNYPSFFFFLSTCPTVTVTSTHAFC